MPDVDPYNVQLACIIVSILIALGVALLYLLNTLLGVTLKGAAAIALGAVLLIVFIMCALSFTAALLLLALPFVVLTVGIPFLLCAVVYKVVCFLDDDDNSLEECKYEKDTDSRSN